MSISLKSHDFKYSVAFTNKIGSFLAFQKKNGTVYLMSKVKFPQAKPVESHRSIEPCRSSYDMSKFCLWWQMLILKSSTFNFRHQLQAYHIIQRSSCPEESHVKSCPGDFPSTWAVSAEPSVSLREARSDLFYAEERGFF